MTPLEALLAHISILSRNSEPSERRNRQCL